MPAAFLAVLVGLHELHVRALPLVMVQSLVGLGWLAAILAGSLLLLLLMLLANMYSLYCMPSGGSLHPGAPTAAHSTTQA